MIPAILSPSSRRRTAHDGFALVIALSLMAFVLLLLLSITTLVQVETQSAEIASAQVEAEQAALLGLQMALGELQKAAGPDQRVTATADIFNVSNDPDFEQPHLLGVWKSSKQANSDTGDIDYAAKRLHEDTGGDFVQWLSSATVTNQKDLAYAAQEPDPSNRIKLVGGGTVSDSAGHIEVPLIDVDTSSGGGGTGKYGWQVFDESQKANLSLESGDASDDFSKILALGGAGRLGYEHVEDFKDLDTLDERTSAKLVSYNSIELGVSNFDLAASNAFYALTNLSRGLLVDVTQGKFQTDLSLLFADDALPAAYSGRHLYSDSQIPIATDPERFGGDDTGGFVQPLPNPDPTWDLLHSHYRLYRDVEENSGEYYMPLGNSLTNDPASGVTPIFNYGSGFDLLNNPVKTVNAGFENNQQILPVVSNAQFIYSLMNSYDLTEARCQAQVVTDVVVTLWNPYNFNIEVDNMELEFYRFPVSFAFYRRDSVNGLVDVSPGDYFHVSNMHNPGNIAGVGANASWDLRDSVPYRVRITGTKLAPGEFRVFGVTDYNDNVYNPPRNNLPIMNFAASYLTHGMVLENGFDETQGGVQTSAIMWKDDGSPGQEHGWLYGALGESVTVAAKSRMVADGYGGFKDLNGEEPGAFIKMYMGDGGDLSPLPRGTINFDATLAELYENGNRAPIGAIVLNSSNLSVVMPDIDVSDTPEHALGNYTGWKDPLKAKTPMVIASLRLKTEQSTNDIDSEPNSRKWLSNGITNPYFSNGLAGDQNLDEQNLQYELTWEPLSDWSTIPAVSHTNGKGYGGSGVDPETGVHQAVVSQIPLAPATSIAQFSHAPLNKSGLAPLTSQIVGNSFATPVIERDKKMEDYDALKTQYLDHSYLANSTLFDGYFLSTAVDETNQAVAVSAPRSLATTLTEFFSGVSPLNNPSYEGIVSQNPGITAGSYDDFANYLYNKGAFNVNSTSVEAWALFLASGSQEALPILDALTANKNLSDSVASEDDLVAFSRFSPMLGNNYADSDKANDPARWQGGARRLSSDDIWDDKGTPDNPSDDTGLASEIVKQVKLRGPFQSVSEFVNRRLSNDVLGDYGALQAAINASNINASHGWDVDAPINDSEIGGTGTGSTSDGAPDQLTQADLLNRLAPSLTVRGDTFRIRAYGEVQGTFGNVSSAICEAVVQRTHDYVDSSSDASNVAYRDLTPSSPNQIFGRKLKIVSFRWLSQDEI
jgi:hypothetical protein